MGFGGGGGLVLQCVYPRLKKNLRQKDKFVEGKQICIKWQVGKCVNNNK